MTKNWLHRSLDRIFGEAEEINDRHRCSTYLYRWVLAIAKGRRVYFRPEALGPKIDGADVKIYLHKFVGNDWSRDLHDHPKRFISIGIWGSYLEETPAGFKRYRAPWIRTFPAEHIHRLTTPWGICWTIVIVLKTTRQWGFWHLGKFMPWHEYVGGADGIADKMKDCP